MTQSNNSLPQASASALKHSKQLSERIIARINNHGGVISFHDFMHMALYEPGLGYYVTGNTKFGAAGDFITAPEISPLFGQCLLSHCLPTLAALSEPTILEFGAGTGKLCASILAELKRIDQAIAHYYILEPSPELQHRQHKLIKDAHPEALSIVTWLDELPKNLSAVVLANEVLDAMPINAFQVKRGQCYQSIVALDSQNQFKLELGKALPNTALPQSLKLALPDLPENYRSEFNPHIKPWLSSLYHMLDQGQVLLIDYGYEGRDYYHLERHMGTLICHYRQHAHEDPFYMPGLQDITANVDFSDIANRADEIGFEVLSYHLQSHFLLHNNLEMHYQRAIENNPDHLYTLAQQIRTLTMPSQMGDRFKVMGLGKNLPPLLSEHGQTRLSRLMRLDRRALL